MREEGTKNLLTREKTALFMTAVRSAHLSVGLQIYRLIGASLPAGHRLTVMIPYFKLAFCTVGAADQNDSMDATMSFL